MNVIDEETPRKLFPYLGLKVMFVRVTTLVTQSNQILFQLFMTHS